jgi:hypothetical protein
MIKNAVLHLLNEQPLMADIEAQPKASDLVLICTNLRMMNGARPVFIDRMESTFVFPYSQVRFIEVPRVAKTAKPPGGGQETALPGGPPGAPAPTPEPPPEAEGELEIDEDFLRRVREA